MSFNDCFTSEIMRAHRGRWFVYVGDGSPEYPRKKIPYQATMRGTWGYDVVCSCGEFETKTGGGTRRYVEDLLWDHRWLASVKQYESEES